MTHYGHYPHYCIITVDTAFPILRAHDIVPDVVVVVDAQIYNTKDFLHGIDPTTVVAFDITTHPSLPRILHAQPTAFFASAFADIFLLDILDAEGLLPHKDRCAWLCGCHSALPFPLPYQKEIYMIGMDCNYQMGKSHCRGGADVAHRCYALWRMPPIP